MKYKVCAYLGCILLLLSTTLSVSAEGIKQNTLEICIDTNTFSADSIRLNTEIYEEAKSIVNDEHVNECFGNSSSLLFRSFTDNLDPLMPIAISMCETGCWIDTRYTWSSAIYSSVLLSSGIDMSNLKVEDVNTDMFIITGNDRYLGCGSNCTAPEKSHYHFSGVNDNDSLGPLQILRHYVEVPGYIEYSCGATVIDLMCWRDNLNYFFHTQCAAFARDNHWNKDYSISNNYETVALIAVAHNTGSAFQGAESEISECGSLWLDAGAVFEYCNAISTDTATSVLKKYVDTWYDKSLNLIKENKEFMLPGQCGTTEMDKLLKEMNIDKVKFALSFGHKQYYPLKAVLNYMALEKLYMSGLESSTSE